MAEWVPLTASILLVAACGDVRSGGVLAAGRDRATVEQQAAHGDRRARGMLASFRSLSTQLAGVQVGIMLTNLVIGLLAESAIAGLLHRKPRRPAADGKAAVSP